LGTAAVGNTGNLNPIFTERSIRIIRKERTVKTIYSKKRNFLISVVGDSVSKEEDVLGELDAVMHDVQTYGKETAGFTNQGTFVE